jgi:hypothetical protein
MQPFFTSVNSFSELTLCFAGQVEVRVVEQVLLELGVNLGPITIFGDFSQFSAKKIGVFLIYQCYDQFFQNLALFLVKKRQYFRKNFRRKYF